jgi:hypothetical protein
VLARRADGRAIAGLLLLAIGVLLLLQNLGVPSVLSSVLLAIFFGLAGVAFLALFLTSADNWWAAIPGFALLSLGTLIGMQSVDPRLGSQWGGSLFLGGIGLGFWAVYAARRENWWAIIPGGVLLTLAVVAGEGRGAGREVGGIFFLGLGLTFGLVYLLPNPAGRMSWALIPALVLLVLGISITAAAPEVFGGLWPLLLILAGLYLLYRSRRLPRS